MDYTMKELQVMISHLREAETEELVLISELVFEYNNERLELSLHFERLIRYLGWSFDWNLLLPEIFKLSF